MCTWFTVLSKRAIRFDIEIRVRKSEQAFLVFTRQSYNLVHELGFTKHVLDNVPLCYIIFKKVKTTPKFHASTPSTGILSMLHVHVTCRSESFGQNKFSLLRWCIKQLHGFINEFTLLAKYLPRYFTVLNLHSLKKAIETIDSCWWKNIQFLLHILKTAFLKEGMPRCEKWFSLKFQFYSWNFQLSKI